VCVFAENVTNSDLSKATCMSSIQDSVQNNSIPKHKYTVMW